MASLALILVGVIILMAVLLVVVYLITNFVCVKEMSFRACVLAYKKAPPKLIGAIMPAEQLCGWLRNICGWGG